MSHSVHLEVVGSGDESDEKKRKDSVQSGNGFKMVGLVMEWETFWA